MSTATESASAAAGRRVPLAQVLGAAMGGVALQLTPVSAAAQKLKLDLSLESQVMATSNAGQTTAADARSDLVLDLHPKARLRTQGGGLRLDMTVGAVARQYAKGTQPNRLEPELDLRASAEVIEGWVTLDGSSSITSTSGDPFTARTESNADIAPQASRQTRTTLTPRLRRDLSPEWQLRAASENTWQRTNDPAASLGARQTTHAENTVVRVERLPVPAGISMEVRRQRQTNDAALRDGTVLAIDATRLGASYRVQPQLIAGLVVGRERSTYLSRDDTDTIVGIQTEWQPNERAWLRGDAEKRFFGYSYELGVGYRSPFMALSGRFSRQPGISASSLGSGGAGSEVATLLDSLLTTRIPNPVERADAVNRLITERGLPARLGTATEIVDQTPQLVQNGQVSLVLLGVRHSVALSLFQRSATELKRDGELSLGLSAGDFRQRGGSAVFSRRLSPTMTLGLTVDRSITEGLGASAGDYLRDWRVRSDLSVALGPRTQATFGVGRQLVQSNRTGNRNESRAHVGLLQNF